MPNPSHETKFPGGNWEREIFISPVQLTTSKTGNLTPVDPPRALYDNMHTYIHTRYIPGTFYSILSVDIILEMRLHLLSPNYVTTMRKIIQTSIPMLETVEGLVSPDYIRIFLLYASCLEVMH